MSITIKGLDAIGLKASDWRVDFTSPTVVVTGPNGTGKSRIRNALEYLFGLKIEGAASASGSGVIGLVAGDRLRVSALVEINGTEHTIARERVLDRGTFKQSVLNIDGKPATQADLVALLGGEVAINPGASLMDLSADALRAELARLALTIKASKDGGTVGEMPTTPETLAAERERRKKAVNAANDTLRGAQRSLDASVRAAPDSPVRPEQVQAAQARAEAQRAAFTAWSAEHAAVQARHNAANDAMREWSNTRARLANDAQASAWTAAGPAMTLEAAQALKAESVRGIAESNELLEWVNDDLEKFRADAARTSTDKAQADAALDSAMRARAALDHDQCPTCGQSITDDLVRTFADVVTDRRNVAQAATEAAQQAAERVKLAVAEAAEHTEAIKRHRDNATRADAAIRDAERAKARDEAHAAAVAALGAHEAKRPQSSESTSAELAAILNRKPEVGGAEAEIARLSAESAAHRRLLDDKAAKDAAEKAANDAKAALKALAEYEETLTDVAAQAIATTAAEYLPPGLRVGFDGDVVALEDVQTGARWHGVGLSAGQRVVLETALSEAIYAITGASVRLALVEADDVEGPVLRALMGGLEAAVAFGTLDFAAVITCHDPGEREGWQRIGPVVEAAALPPPVPHQFSAPVAITAEDAALIQASVDARTTQDAINAERNDDAPMTAEQAEWLDSRPDPLPKIPDGSMVLFCNESADMAVFGDPPDADHAGPNLAAPLTPEQAAAINGWIGAPADANEPQPESKPADGSPVATAKEIAAIITAAKPSTDALRALANEHKRKLTAAPLKRLAVERMAAAGVTQAVAVAEVDAACAANPKRAYERKAGDAAGAESGGSDQAEGENDTDAQKEVDAESDRD